MEQTKYVEWMMAVVAFVLGAKKGDSFESAVEMNDEGGITRTSWNGDSFTYTLAEVNGWLVALMASLTSGTPLPCVGIKGDACVDGGIDMVHLLTKVPAAFRHNLPDIAKPKAIAGWLEQTASVNKAGRISTVGGRIASGLNGGIKHNLKEGKKYNAKPKQASSASAPSANNQQYADLRAEGFTAAEATRMMNGN